MTKKLSAAKLKAHLAMAAFVVVAIITATLTSAGIFEYTTLNIDVQTNTNQVSVQPASLSSTSAWSRLAGLLGN